MSVAAAAVDYPADWDDVEEPAQAPKNPWSKRKQSQYELACNLRDGLRAALGDKCGKCGTVEALEFHHPKGRTWVAKQKNLAQRMRLYWRDHRSGLIELLCSRCNKSAGAPNGFWQRSKQRRRK